MNELIGKLKEVLMSVLPITCIVLILHFTISPLHAHMMSAFLIGSVLIIIGLTVFLYGIDLGLEPIGHGVGNAITKSGKYAVVMTVCLVLGFFISYAEPDLHILAKQVDEATYNHFRKTLMVTAVSVGIAAMMTVGMLRILKNIRLKYVFTGAYGLIFILSLFSSSDFLAIAFDASGATTGAITVPFMLALAAGVSAMKKDNYSNEADSFGVIGIASTGAIIGVLISGLFLGESQLSGMAAEASSFTTDIAHVYSSEFRHIARESFFTLLPIIITYIFLQIRVFKQKRKRVLDIARGILFTFLGLVLFLLGVNGGFMEVGSQLGMRLASGDSAVPILLVALLLGVSTVLAEPAVHVLTHQVEEVTGGSVKRRLVLIFLSMAVGSAIFLSALRILLPDIRLWMYLLPGFGLAVILSYFVPDLFVGMAIDAGGVASGPMTATFSLSFVQGIAARTPTADIVTDGFGMIAIVAMMPIIAIEVLGMLYEMKLRKRSAVKQHKKHGGSHDEQDDRSGVKSGIPDGNAHSE